MIRAPIGRRILAAAGLLLLGSSLQGDTTRRFPEPEDSGVKNGVFMAEYFGLRYPLPAGWTEDLKGPEPSATGYYSLAALKPDDGLAATMQISAQDNFFAAEPVEHSTDFLVDMKQHLDPSLAPMGAVVSVEIGGRSFSRLEYSGAGLNHSVFATEIRCHTLIISITSGSKETIAGLVQSLQKMTFSPEVRSGGSSRSDAPNPAWPLCLRDYVSPADTVHKVDPEMTGPRYGSVPLRIIIGADGKIEHVHAIAGFPEQIKSVTGALVQWEFKPYMVDGKPVVVETGLLFQFPKASQQRESGR